MKNELIWLNQSKKVKITELKQLLDYLINIKQENIDKEIKDNLNNMIQWIEENFPKQLGLVTRIKTESKEYTSQQIRERLIRDLRAVA